MRYGIYFYPSVTIANVNIEERGGEQMCLQKRMEKSSFSRSNCLLSPIRKPRNDKRYIFVTGLQLVGYLRMIHQSIVPLAGHSPALQIPVGQVLFLDVCLKGLDPKLFFHIFVEPALGYYENSAQSVI